MLYSLKAADFHDITTGNNGYAAGPGYDMVTGIGSPVANQLVPDLVTVGLTGTVGFSASAYELGVPATVTVGDLDLAGDPSCTVTLSSSAGDSEPLSLPALGGGVFQRSIPTSSGAVVPGDGILEAVPGGTITVSYYDVGDTTTVTNQATMFRVDHFTFTTIGGPEGDSVPFAVTVSAYDSSNNLISDYNGTAALTASGSAGPVGASPTSVTFAGGTWLGNVTVNTVAPAVTLGVDDPLAPPARAMRLPCNPDRWLVFSGTPSRPRKSKAPPSR